MVQFCANDPQYLIKAAHMVAPYCDAVDINFGCPQRIAKRGNYGAFLMDDWKIVESLVRELSQSLSIPVTCKIRVFPDVEKTVAYARMIEAAGCQLLAVHGRLREQKDNTATRADWDKIRAVREALRIPVLGNGNIQVGWIIFTSCLGTRYMGGDGAGKGMPCMCCAMACPFTSTCAVRSSGSVAA